jgi:putative heme iron utilization protein
MKVPTTIYPEPQDVEVEISFDQILQALEEQPDRVFSLCQFYNKIAGVLNAVPDELVELISASSKTVIRDFLLKQAKRLE